MSTAPVVRSAWVNRPIDQAFSVFTDEIGAWWPLPTHGLFGETSGVVVFDGERLIERSTDGSEAVWGHVTTWEPPRRVTIAWHPGRSLEEASEVEVSFSERNEGTDVVIEHRGWQVFGADAANRRLGYVGPNAWGYVLDHFADGAEVRPDAVDVAGLASAYACFYDVAARGSFAEAPIGEWGAAETLAHVALNDVAMLAVTQALVHRDNEKAAVVRFENTQCHDGDALGRWADASGDMAGLIRRGRELASLVCASMQRLSADQLQTLVHCHLVHDGEVMLDGPMKWGTIAVATQAEMHLPAHAEQLENLRV